MAGRGSDGGKPDDYDEIDQIYDYVRGFAPLPKSAKGWQYFAEKADPPQKEAVYQKLAPAQPSSDSENKPPDPPPIETIPGRKASPMDVTPPMTPPFRYSVYSTTIKSGQTRRTFFQPALESSPRGWDGVDGPPRPQWSDDRDCASPPPRHGETPQRCPVQDL